MKKSLLIAFILIITIAFRVEAQNLDQDCDPVAVPPECAQLSETVRSLEERIERLQQRLNSASPAAKANLLATIQRLTSELDTAKADFRRCLREEGPNPPELSPDELTSRVTGRARLETTNSNAPGPHYAEELDFDIRFSRNRCNVTITRFPRITITTERIPNVGRVTVRVTKTGGGTGRFHPVSGRMNIAITLHFRYSHPLASDDDADFSLSTDASITLNNGDVVRGFPLNAEGNIRLVGSGKFRNGFLSPSTGNLVVRANLSPRP